MMKNSTVRILVILALVPFVGGSSYWFVHVLGQISPVLKIGWLICALPYGWMLGKMTSEWLNRNYPLDEY
jgi:hypothetical protein